MTTEQFSELKEEILRRAKEASACREQYGRAYKAESMSELCAVLKDNFWWAIHNSVLDIPLLEKYRDGFAQHDIFVNVSVERGFLLCGNATVKAWGNATVEACDNATVEAWGNAYVSSYVIVECKLSGNAIYRIRRDNIIRFASDSLKFEKI